MGGTPHLYDTLVQVLSQHQNWVDLRHLKTLAWMIVGLMQSGKIGLTAWAPYVHSRAVYAQSRVRRFARWLDNHRIDVHALYGPLMQQALTEWGEQSPLSGLGYLYPVEYLLSGAHLARVSWTGDSDRVESPGTSQQQCGL